MWKRINFFALCFTIFFVFTARLVCAENQEVVQQTQSSPTPQTNIDLTKVNYLRPAEKEKLVKNGFVISIPNRSTTYPEDEAVGIYDKCKNSHFPVFITSDIVLHSSHLLFDWAVRFLEISSLRQDLLNLTDAMLSQSLAYQDLIQDKGLKDAAFKNALFFNVAKSLLAGGNLNELPDDIKKVIGQELALINEHAGFAPSPLFGREEDYSQYVPRGHYSRSPEFEQYFKTMMWYGRQSFRLAPVQKTDKGYSIDKKTSFEETLQALLISKALNETEIKGETALAVWERIYETTSYFAGKSDDLSVREYIKFMAEVFGQDLPLNSLTNESKVTEFVNKARQLPKPKILSTRMSDVSAQSVDWTTQTQCFRFMGQRFTPDAHIIQNLVYSKVTGYKGDDPKPFTAVLVNGVWLRGFPRGLDVMAVLGSGVAGQILLSEKDTDFDGYNEQFSKLKAEYALLKEDIWTQDLYSRRLWALKSILEKPGENVPFFMRSDAWFKKQLNTSLSSWTELKHDTILYSKQPYGMAQMAMQGKGGWERFLPAEVVHGYVEPVPELYSRVRGSVEQLRLKLTSLGFPKDQAFKGNLQLFETFLMSLETISKKELSQTSLSDEEYELIEGVGHRLSHFLTFAHYGDVTEAFRDEMDNKMPLVADVFTDVNSGQVLEEAIGHPAEIFVIAPVDGKDKICMGVVYSHYEFKQPLNDRLTDESWRAMIKGKQFPATAKWLEDIAVIQNANDR